MPFLLSKVISSELQGESISTSAFTFWKMTRALAKKLQSSPRTRGRQQSGQQGQL